MTSASRPIFESHAKNIGHHAPTLNQGRYIGEAIRSVLMQDYPDFELIIIDGGSTDGTLSEISKFGDRIHHWLSEKDSGQSNAINKGLGLATGEIITWLNSDDRYTQGALSQAAQLFAGHPGAAFVHGRAELFGSNRASRIIGPASALRPHEYLPYMRFPQPSSFFSRSVIQASLPVNEALHYCMDFELVARCILSNGQAAATPQVLSGYRLHGDSKSNHEDRFLAEWANVLINIFNSISGGDIFAKKMSDLGLDHRKAASVFPCPRNFTFEELHEIFLEHLHLHFHYHYRNMSKETCERLYSVIRSEDRVFAEKKQYRKFLFRLRYLHGLLRLKRRLTS